jgi:hypothetical protein
MVAAMAVKEISSSAVVGGAETLALSQFFTVSAGASPPAYLVVNALDRNEYTAAATDDTGSFVGNGATLGLSTVSGDARGAGIVFTWQAAAGQYVNATYGALNQLDFTTSGSLYDVTDLSLFATGRLAVAQQDGADAYALMQADAAGYLGTATLSTDSGFAGPMPAQATPDSVAAAALRFVGDAWNDEGCWVLASTIAAEAGAALPVQSTAIGVAGRPNGEWVVVYNGPLDAVGNWQGLVTKGDVIAFGTPGGGGHVTTCVSGSGASAELVDNITYVNGRGQITNLANDGSAEDVTIAAPHPAAQEWAGVAARSVVIYALDTPVVTDRVVDPTLVTGAAETLAGLFAVSDPAGRAVSAYQVYAAAGAASLMVGGVAQSAGSAASAVTVASLGGISLQAGNAAGTDSVFVRAYNGAYWGDWQSVAVAVDVPKPPVVTERTAALTWQQGQSVHFVLPAGAFSDPQHEALTYSTGALPRWLSFDPATRGFSGTVPAGLESFNIVVTATDTSGLAGSETIAVTVAAAAPVVATKLPAQSWAEGSTVSFALPAGNITDPQGEALTYKASLANGGALPGWLTFTAAGLSFSGTAPEVAESLQVRITATDTSHLSVSETLNIAIVQAATGFSVADWQPGLLDVAAGDLGVVVVDPGGALPHIAPLDTIWALPLHHHS